MKGQTYYLKINVNMRVHTKEVLPDKVLLDTAGGVGLGAKFLLENFEPGLTWEHPGNPFMLFCGALSGTLVAGSGTICIVTQGAMTNMAASSQANGFLGAFLRSNGYYGLHITGRARDWIYLLISDGKLEYRSAEHLLGLDTFELQEAVQAESNCPAGRLSVYGIGPAGENLVRFACVVGDYGHVAAHNGVGAVMGSKRIKAIAVVRGQEKVAVFDPDKLKESANKLFSLSRGGVYENYGTAGNLSIHHDFGRLPIKNYTTSVWSAHEKMNGQSLRENYASKRKSCWRCSMHSRWIEIPAGPHKGTMGEEPEYECAASCGAVIDNQDPDAMIMLSNLLDRLGLDVNESGWILGWAMEGYEKGWLDKDFLDGLDLTWGNVEESSELLRRISNRQGVGSLLAEGVKRVAESLGGEAYQAGVFTLKGNTPRSHDHRGRWEEFLDTCLSNTGTIEVTGGVGDFSELGIVPPSDYFNPLEVARTNAQINGRRQFEDCLGICRFTAPKFQLLIDCVNAVTGWSLDIDAAMKIGLRAINALRVYNILHGLEASAEWPSPRYGLPPVDGPLEGLAIMQSYAEMRQTYWRYMGWDEESGRPLPITLSNLGMGKWIKMLWADL